MDEATRIGKYSAVSSTEAQNNFGEVLTRAVREGTVFMTRYRRPEAVVLSMEAYSALVAEVAVDLEQLERDFDAMVARMQTGSHAAAVDALFTHTPEQLGRAAKDAVRNEE